MSDHSKHSLFFIRSHPSFSEGTLLKLDDTLVPAASLDPSFGQKFNTIPENEYEVTGYLLPDRGDGLPGFISSADVLLCPPFAENVPPGKCPVLITCQRVISDADPLFSDNPNNIGIFGITVEEDLHRQVLSIPLPPKFPQIRSVTLTDTLKDLGIESYEDPTPEDIANGRALWLHTGHIGPGFYQMDLKLEHGRILRVRFIKLFPPEFNARYETLKNAQANTPVAAHRDISMPVSLYHAHPEDNDIYEFPAAMMNQALAFATEWGENFRKPIDERMLRIYPSLKPEQIIRLKEIADAAEACILKLAEDELAGRIDESDIAMIARQKHPWIDERELYRLRNIGMYWARK